MKHDFESFEPIDSCIKELKKCTPAILKAKDIQCILEPKIKSTAKQVEQEKGNIKPKLVIVIIGEEIDTNSKRYVEMKERKAKSLGIDIEMIGITSQEANQQKILDLLSKLDDPNNPADGIILQMPDADTQKLIKEKCPDKTLNFKELADTILNKDVDGLSKTSQEKLENDLHDTFAPATAKGIMYLLRGYGIELRYKNIAVIGSEGMLVGKPICKLLEGAGANLTRLDLKLKKTKQSDVEYIKYEKEVTKNADIVLLATGVPHLAKPDWFKDNNSQIVLDAGFTISDNLPPRGNLDPESYDQLKAYNPTTGALGPLTVDSLLMNTLENAQKRLLTSTN